MREKSFNNQGLSDWVGSNEREPEQEQEGLRRGDYTIKAGRMHLKEELMRYLRNSLHIDCYLNPNSHELTFSIKNHGEGVSVLNKIKELGLKYKAS